MTATHFAWFGAVLLTGSAGATMIACGSDDAPPAAEPTNDGGSTVRPSGDASTPTPSGDGGSTTAPRPADEAGVTSDGGIDPPDAGPGGDTANIACGTTTCPIPAETCCVSELSSGGDRSFACVAGATCPNPGGDGDVAALKCSSSANCAAGTVCCVSENDGRAASECKASCGNGEAQLCDQNAPDGGGCPSSDPCSNDNIGDWGNLPRGYATCGGQEP